MNRGYVKLWRKTIDSGIMQNPVLWTFWSWCLIKASHKPCKIMVCYQEVPLEAGQFVFGRKMAAKELRLTQQSIRTCVASLVKMENLTIKSTNKFSVITITNWHIYQECENEINHQINQQLTSNQPATNQQLTTNKNVKKNIQVKDRLEDINSHCANSDESAPMATPKKHIPYTKDFETFWRAYPRKTGKGAAWNSWRRLNGSKPDDMEIILNAIDQHRRTEQWNRDGGQYIPLPATWLNQRRWEDDPESAKQMSLDLIRAELEERKRGI